MSSNPSTRRGHPKKKIKLSETLTSANTTSSKITPASPDDSGRASPDSSCAICLGRHENKSFTNNCLHEFCFTCLLEWSKVKAECPLCKQPFTSIIHNVRSNQEYDEHKIPILEPTEPDLSAFDLVTHFRYRTTNWPPTERTAVALERLSYLRQFALDGILPRQTARRPTRSRSRFTGTSSFRRQTYQRDLWVRPLADITGRYRETTPEFFQLNPAMTHRLVPWLNRELNVLLTSHENRLSFVMELILRLITQHHIRSRPFREAIQEHIGPYTEHFIHEFFQFARSPYDMYGFDENAVYEPRTTLQHEEVAVSESSDEDVPSGRSVNNVLRELVEPRDIPLPPSPQPGPSGFGRGSSTVLVDDGQSYGAVSGPSSSSRRPSDEDEDDDEDVEIVQVVRPPLPEVITLSDSENDEEEEEGDKGERAESSSSTSRGKALKKTSKSRSPSKRSPSAKEQRSKSSKKKKRKRNRSASDETSSNRNVRPREAEEYRVREVSSTSSHHTSLPRYWDMDPEEIQRSLRRGKRNYSDEGANSSTGDHYRHKRGRKS